MEKLKIDDSTLLCQKFENIKLDDEPMKLKVIVFDRRPPFIKRSAEPC
jgi:hypothetical protein